MRRLFRFLFQLVAAVVLFVAITVAWIIFDGLNDVGDSADAALVVGDDPYSSNGVTEVERVTKLYKDGEFQKIIVSTESGANYEEQASITKYLEGHGVPSGAIIEVTGAETFGDMAHDVASIMKSHDFMSVMLVTDYYRVSRLKLALLHAGVPDIKKTHIGSVRKEDALPIAREVIALYDYVGRTFLLPAAKKIKDEAATAGDKAKVEAQKAKDTVNKGLDTLPK
jgi:vancomycin permeability regulator SanA